MKDLVPYLQDAVAIAFVALGLVTAISRLRRRDRSLGFLALAIILLAAVSGLGRVQAHLPFMVPWLGVINLAGFMASAYALLLYRDTIIPLPRRWHVVAIVALASASVFPLAAQATAAPQWVLIASLVFLIVVWCACVGEPTVRFWLVARGLPAVQAWRLRSLSLGFGGFVVLLVVAVPVALLVKQPLVQIIFELVALAIVPLLYASFSPPSWLRRQWRAGEEEGLRAFMEDLLVSENRDALASRALELAVRLVGGGSAVLFNAQGTATSTRGPEPAAVGEPSGSLSSLLSGVSRITLAGDESSVMALPIAGLSGSGTLVVMAGPFTPGFVGDYLNRIQQLMSA